MTNLKKVQAFLFALAKNNMNFSENGNAKSIIPGKAFYDLRGLGLLFEWFGSGKRYRDLKYSRKNAKKLGKISSQFKCFSEALSSLKMTIKCPDLLEKKLVEHCNMTFHELLSHYSGVKFDFIFEFDWNELEKRVDEKSKKIKTAKEILGHILLACDQPTNQQPSSSAMASSSRSSSSTSRSSKKRKREPTEKEIQHARETLSALAIQNPTFLKEGLRVFELSQKVESEFLGFECIEGFIDYIPKEELRKIIAKISTRDPKMDEHQIVDLIVSRAENFLEEKIKEISTQKEYFAALSGETQ